MKIVKIEKKKSQISRDEPIQGITINHIQMLSGDIAVIPS